MTSHFRSPCQSQANIQPSVGDKPLSRLLQQGRELFKSPLHADAVLGAQLIHLAVVDETVRPSDAHDWRVYLQFAQSLENSAAESAHQDVIFECNDDADAARILRNQFPIERLNEAGIDDGRGKSLPAEFRSKLLGKR